MMIGGELVLKQSVIKSRMCSKQYQLNDTNIVQSINHYDVLYPLLSLTKYYHPKQKFITPNEALKSQG